MKDNQIMPKTKAEKIHFTSFVIWTTRCFTLNLFTASLSLFFSSSDFVFCSFIRRWLLFNLISFCSLIYFFLIFMSLIHRIDFLCFVCVNLKFSFLSSTCNRFFTTLFFSSLESSNWFRFFSYIFISFEFYCVLLLRLCNFIVCLYRKKKKRERNLSSENTKWTVKKYNQENDQKKDDENIYICLFVLFVSVWFFGRMNLIMIFALRD